jgi:hypothetical protein
MEENRNLDDMPNRSSNMEPAEGSRETVRNSGSDLGTSSDRAMFDESMSEGGSERGLGESGERTSGSSKGGGITNRELSREQSEQEQLPPRGQSQSER